MGLIGDSSDKKQTVMASSLEDFERIKERAEKGWAITASDAKLLADLATLAMETYGTVGVRKLWLLKEARDGGSPAGHR